MLDVSQLAQLTMAPSLDCKCVSQAVERASITATNDQCHCHRLPFAVYLLTCTMHRLPFTIRLDVYLAGTTFVLFSWYLLWPASEWAEGRRAKYNTNNNNNNNEGRVDCEGEKAKGEKAKGQLHYSLASAVTPRESIVTLLLHPSLCSHTWPCKLGYHLLEREKMKVIQGNRLLTDVRDVSESTLQLAESLIETVALVSHTRLLSSSRLLGY